MPKPSADDDQVVLSYHDCLLRKADINLLKGPYWLNDAVIGFYFEYLERSIGELGSPKDIKFASPELTQLLKMMELTEYPSLLDSVITESTDVVFFPLNNSTKRDEVGGSHWSLLVYSKDEKSCWHFDSSGMSNHSIASAFANKLMKYLLKTTTAKFHDVQCPQQNNSYDCGIFVLVIAEIMLQCIKSQGAVDKCNLAEVNKLVQTARTKILELILDLSTQQN